MRGPAATAGRSRPGWARALAAVSWAIALAVVVGSVLTLFAQRLWLGDLLLMFRPHFLALILLALAAALLARRPLLVALNLALAGWYAAALLWPVPQPQLLTRESQALRVMTFNVLFESEAIDRWREYVEREQPDVVVLQEAYPPWREAVAQMTQRYPYNTLAGTGRYFQLVVMSRYPIREQQNLAGTEATGGGDIYAFLVKLVLDVEGTPVTLFGVHPPTPREPDLWRPRNRYLSELADLVAREVVDRPTIVAGDFNTVPWSPFFLDLLSRTGLVNASGERWPAATRILKEYRLPAPLGAPIDHILVSPGIGVVRAGNGPDLGSDHLPVIADLEVPRAHPAVTGREPVAFLGTSAPNAAPRAH